MSLQVCHCGWSKVTTYHGLRTHQGKMGCMARGQKDEECGQPYVGGLADYQKDFKLDVYTPIKNADYYSDMSLQECHCGWSKVTTYQGLRIHQGKMGCTPKGVRIPKEEQGAWKNWLEVVDQLEHQPAKRASVKKQREPLPNTHTIAAEITCKIQLEYEPLPAPPRRYSQMDTIPNAGRQLQDSSTGVQREPLSPRPNSHTTAAELLGKIKRGKKTIPPPPPRSSQTDTISNSGRQLQDSSTGVRREPLSPRPNSHTTAAELFGKIKRGKKPSMYRLQDSSTGVQENRLVRDQPTFPPQTEVVRPRQKDWRDPKSSEVRQDRIRVDVKHEIQMREQQVAQARSSVKANEGILAAEWLEITSVFSDVVRIAEDAKRKSLDRPFSTLRTITSTMMEQIQQKLDKLAVIDLKWISNFAVDVELDPTTAYECLVSADGKRLSNRGGTQGARRRFGSILGRNRLTSGKSYWEVEVGNQTGWSLGVATGDAQRNGRILLCPENGYWVAEHYENKFAALTNPPVGLPLKEKPQKVGVFVEYKEGLVSFYDVTAQSLIYSFTECSFTEGIYPYFILHLKEDGSADPLIISTVKRQ